MSYYVNPHEPEPLNAPPRGLMYAVIMVFLVILAVLVGLFIFLANGRRLAALVPFMMMVAIAAPLVTIGGALIFRRGLPRLFALWITVLWVFIGAGAVFGGIYAYRSLLPPRYQEEMLTYAPFMRALLPPTPAGGVIPTVGAIEGGLSPEDLLNLPLLGGTATSEPEVTAEAQTPTPENTPTSAPTAEPTPTLIPTDAPTPAPTEAAVVPTQPAPTAAPVSQTSSLGRPVAARMYGFRHEIQGWNNCGPTNITMGLSFFGWQENQDYAARFLRPEAEDKNVSPHELVNFVNEQSQVRALYRVGGDMELIKRLIAGNFPVIVETAYAFEGYDWIGHYQTVVGYDDLAASFYIYDSYIGTGANGEGIPTTYANFDSNWQAFNRIFIVLYRPADEPAVAAILGDRVDVQTANEMALAVAQEEARANPQNMYTWFNIGTSLTRLGRYEEAANFYDRARQLGLPFRMTWYQFGMFEAYFNVGRYDDVMALVQTNLTNGARYVEETHYWQGQVYAARGEISNARSAYQRALSLNPRFEAARAALDSLNA